MAYSIPHATTDVIPTDNNRRQLRTTLQRIRRQAMTEEQRQEYLSRRRTNYQRRYGIATEDSTLNVSNAVPKSIEDNMSQQRERRRTVDRKRRNLMTVDERTTYLARRRDAYRRRNQPSMSSSREGYRFGEILDGRYEIISDHGRGVFSTVVRAKDLKDKFSDPEEVAIKIIRNNETMYKAGKEEFIILKKLVKADPENKHHCVRFLSSFNYRNHICLVFVESLHMNLREVLKKFGHYIGLKLTYCCEDVCKTSKTNIHRAETSEKLQCSSL